MFWAVIAKFLDWRWGQLLKRIDWYEEAYKYAKRRALNAEEKRRA